MNCQHKKIPDIWPCRFCVRDFKGTGGVVKALDPSVTRLLRRTQPYIAATSEQTKDLISAGFRVRSRDLHVLP